MRKIIKNKVYNTMTAQYIGAYLGQWESSSHWLREELYKKRTGEYFLYAEGGPGSPYGDGGEASEEIKPLNFEDAKKWGKKHLDPVAYDAEFEIDQNDGNLTRLHALIPGSLHSKLEETASRSGANKTEIVIEALEEFLK